MRVAACCPPLAQALPGGPAGEESAPVVKDHRRHTESMAHSNERSPLIQADPRHGLKHDPLAAIIGPRPIRLDLLRRCQRALNLAACAFSTSSTPRHGSWPSRASAPRTPSAECRCRPAEFRLDLGDTAARHTLNMTSASITPEIDGFGLAGLTPVPSRTREGPARRRKTPVSFECRVSRVMQLNQANSSALDAWMVLGEVVGVHIDRELVTDGVYDTVAARPILRRSGLPDFSLQGQQRDTDADPPPPERVRPHQQAALETGPSTRSRT